MPAILNFLASNSGNIAYVAAKAANAALGTALPTIKISPQEINYITKFVVPYLKAGAGVKIDNIRNTISDFRNRRRTVEQRIMANRGGQEIKRQENLDLARQRESGQNIGGYSAPQEEENYQPFPKYEQQYSIEPDSLDESGQQEAADRIGRMKKTENGETSKNLGEENTEPNVVGNEKVAADELNIQRNADKEKKEKLKGMGIKIVTEAGKKFAKKAASAAWKKVALWIAGLIGPEVGGVLLAIAAVLFVVLFTLAAKCEIVKTFNFLKPVLSWVGVTCEI